MSLPPAGLKNSGIELRMSQLHPDNSRIAKNTLVLYLRMFFVLCVGLLTSRLVLNALGVEDYGIYNVVGGFVVLLTFLNGATVAASQRFITVELARGTVEQQQKVFTSSVMLHMALAILVVIIAETAGLWFVLHEMVIPPDRMLAACWVFHFSVVACVFSILTLPFNALVVAHERMSAFAFITVMDVLLKLAIVCSLLYTSADRLILYAGLMSLIGLVNVIIYAAFCYRNFPDAHFRFVFDGTLFREMGNVAGWSLFGSVAGVAYTQGLNVLLNLFFGPAVNAARGVAVTVQGVVSGFVANFQMAFSPQLIGSYAANELARMHTLVYASSKFSYFLLLLMVLPVMIEAHPILTLWLKIVPDYTVCFLRLILCTMLIDSLVNPLWTSALATGKLSQYQIVVGGTLLLIAPIAYVVLRCGGNPQSVFIVHLVVALITLCIRVAIVSRLIHMPVRVYARKVLLRAAVVSLLAALPVLILRAFLPDSLISSALVVVFSFLATSAAVLIVGLARGERAMLVSKLRVLFAKFV